MNSTVNRYRAMLYRLFILGLALLLACSFMIACGQPMQRPPSPPAIQPPTAKDSQPPAQPPPVNEAADETEWTLIQTLNGKGSETTPSFHISGTKWRIAWTLDTAYPEYAVFDIFVYPDDKRNMPVKRISRSNASTDDIVYIHDGGRDFYINVIAANLSSWSITIEDSAAAEAFVSPVQITYIDYKGRDDVETSDTGYYIFEPDEYVEIKNLSDLPQNITGWVLKNISKGQPAFIFPTFKPCSCSWYQNWQLCIRNCYPPSPCVIEPRKSIRVYTGEVHPESGGFCFYYLPGNIWDNEEANIAVLYDNSGEEMSRKSYIIPTQNGGETR